MCEGLSDKETCAATGTLSETLLESLQETSNEYAVWRGTVRMYCILSHQKARKETVIEI